MALDLDYDEVAVRTSDLSFHYEPQYAMVVQLRRPSQRDREPRAGVNRSLRTERQTPAAHVFGLANSLNCRLTTTLTRYLEAEFRFERKTQTVSSFAVDHIALVK